MTDELHLKDCLARLSAAQIGDVVWMLSRSHYQRDGIKKDLVKIVGGNRTSWEVKCGSWKNSKFDKKTGVERGSDSYSKRRIFGHTDLFDYNCWDQRHLLADKINRLPLEDAAKLHTIAKLLETEIGTS